MGGGGGGGLVPAARLVSCKGMWVPLSVMVAALPAAISAQVAPPNEDSHVFTLALGRVGVPAASLDPQGGGVVQSRFPWMRYVCMAHTGLSRGFINTP